MDFFYEVSLSSSQGSLTCRKILRHGVCGFTSHPNQCVLRNVIALEVHPLGRVWTRDLLGPMASMLTITPPRQLTVSSVLYALFCERWLSRYRRKLFPSSQNKLLHTNPLSRELPVFANLLNASARMWDVCAMQIGYLVSSPAFYFLKYSGMSNYSIKELSLHLSRKNI
jgi:hypothetical protein